VLTWFVVFSIKAVIRRVIMFVNRILGVFKLDAGTFEAVEHDRSATSQAALIVLLVALLSGGGSALGAVLTDSSALSSFFSSLVLTFVGWILVSVITYFVGTTFFKGQATIDEMLRVIGFAFAPQLLSIIPCVGWPIGAIWSLIASFIAIRQGLDLDDARTLFTILIAFVIYIILFIVASLLFGGFNALFR
jgi:hypothetical protein